MKRGAGITVAILTALGASCAREGASRTAAAPRDPMQSHLEATLESAMQRHGFPGAAAAVITSRHTYVTAMGKRRNDRPEMVTIRDRFGLGSNTKAATATMLGVLVERGTLRWNMTLAEALPDVTMRPEYRSVTLHQLLTHRAGLQPWNTFEAHERAKAFDTSDLAAARLELATEVLAEAPVHPPGTETRYSNVGYSLASLMAERATGKSWEALITETVCEPLKLSCNFGAPGATDPNQPWGHSRDSLGLHPADPGGFRPSAMHGAGGLALSIEDYADFLQMHLRGLRGEDQAILRAAAVRDLHTPDGRYALGWGVQDYAGARSSVHAGGNGQFYALVAIQPERDRAVAFLTNDGGDEVEMHASAILKALLAGPPAPAAAAPR